MFSKEDVMQCNNLMLTAYRIIGSRKSFWSITTKIESLTPDLDRGVRNRGHIVATNTKKIPLDLAYL